MGSIPGQEECSQEAYIIYVSAVLQFYSGSLHLENFENRINPWIKSLKIAIMHGRFFTRIRRFVYFNIFFI